MNLFSSHVRSDRLAEAARHASLDGLRDVERRHLQACAQCQRLYGGYRLTDRLLAARWQEVKLPLEAVAQTSRFGFLAELQPRLSARSVVPVAAAVGLALLIGVGVVLPQLLPPPTPTPAVGSQVAQPSASASPSAAPSETATSSKKPGKTSGGGSATPAPGGSPTTLTPIAMATMQGEPMVWAPDGRHFLVARSGDGWTGRHQIHIRDEAGNLTGACDGDDAAWVDSATVAVATRSSGGSEATVSLVRVNGHRKATLPGTFAENSATVALSGGMLIGSGHGQLAIADQGGTHSSGIRYVVWDGHSLSSFHDGVPIAWSANGSRLAVLHQGGHSSTGGSRDWGFGPTLRASGASISGSLEILSFPGLHTVTSVTGDFRVSAGSPVYGYGLDAIFSPDGRRLLISGILVDLSTTTTRQVGQGDWLPDGTLVTTSGGMVLRWQGGHSSQETRLPGGGAIQTSSRGDVIEYFSDSRPPLLLTAQGTVYRLSLAGVASIGSLLLSPDGSAAAFNGCAPGGYPVAAVATLR